MGTAFVLPVFLVNYKPLKGAWLGQVENPERECSCSAAMEYA